MKHTIQLITLICLVPTAANGALTVINSSNAGVASQQFTNAATAAGLIRVATETFEEGIIPSGTGIILADPLETGIANVDSQGLGFPQGLLAPDLRIQSNPFGTNLNMIGDGTAFNQTHCASASGLDSTLDIIFTTADRRAAAFTLLNPQAPLFSVRAEIRVYDTDDQLLGLIVGESSSRVLNFYGVISDAEAIGRINVLTFNGFNAPEGKEFVDDIQMWTAVPEPGGLVGVAGVGWIGLRRRRRQS